MDSGESYQRSNAPPTYLPRPASQGPGPKALEFEQQMQELQDHWLCNSKRLHRAFKPEEFYGFDPFTATNPYV